MPILQFILSQPFAFVYSISTFWTYLYLLIPFFLIILPLVIYCLHLFSVTCWSMHVVVRRHLTGVGSLHVGSRDWSHVFRLRSRHPTEPFTSPKFPLSKRSKLGDNTNHLIDPFKLLGNGILFQLFPVTVWKATGKRKKKTYSWIISCKITGHASVSRALFHTDLAEVTMVFFPLSTHALASFWCFTLWSVSLPTSSAFLDENEVIREKHRAPLLYFPFEDKCSPSS